MLREIWLTDKDNKDIFKFDNFGDFIFTAPTKFGIYRDKNFLIINNARVEIADVPRFEDITGIIIIRGSNNELEGKYALLRDFISKYNNVGFRLYVKTQENKDARYINCSINTLDKSEKTGLTTMSVPINIQPKSLWQGDVVGVSVAQSYENLNTFRFNGYNFGASFKSNNFDSYSIAFGGGQISQAYVRNDGEEQSPLLIRVYGDAVNPFVKLRDFNTGEILQSVKFDGLTIANGNYLEINSNADNTYIEVVNEITGERVDVEDYADQTTNIYMSIPMGSYIIETSDDVPTNLVRTRVFFANQYKGA